MASDFWCCIASHNYFAMTQRLRLTSLASWSGGLEPLFIAKIVGGALPFPPPSGS
ncbi:hypothetical protein BDP27DRAFT_1335281 [Rhodocollybia butyracea]|uniref:Uncharacterized protein n=1 Tax=Rhodocollybia butyracea TaxID=206335 RepID=A0A9P5PH53_9AGAR|nr:hypothetical protein BDP27DRAFT_1335281 [Rhodocollybia butyracea]